MSFLKIQNRFKEHRKGKILSMNLICHDDIVFLLSRVMKVQITKTLILLSKDKIANINSPCRILVQSWTDTGPFPETAILDHNG